jgi:hypothetical protein
VKSGSSARRISTLFASFPSGALPAETHGGKPCALAVSANPASATTAANPRIAES